MGTWEVLWEGKVPSWDHTYQLNLCTHPWNTVLYGIVGVGPLRGTFVIQQAKNS